MIVTILNDFYILNRLNTVEKALTKRIIDMSWLILCFQLLNFWCLLDVNIEFLQNKKTSWCLKFHDLFQKYIIK
jgi:hypothetical protein